MDNKIRIFGVNGQAGNASFDEVMLLLNPTRNHSRADQPLSSIELACLHRSMWETGGYCGLNIDTSPIMLGKFSGRHALNQALKEMELEIDSESLNRIFGRFKEEAEHKSAFTARDLEALAVECLGIGAPQYILGGIEVNESTEAPAEVQVCVHRPDGSAARGSDTNTCTVTAIHGAINRATGIRATLQSFRHGATDGEVLVNVCVCGHVRTGRSVAGDFNEALAAAYLQALSAAIHQAKQEVFGMP
jgi:2-isopropylmalate synthase